MLESLDRFATTVHKRLSAFKLGGPSLEVVEALVEVAYLSSLKTEEGRYVRGSLTYANRGSPEIDQVLTKRADFPSLNRLEKSIPLSVAAFTKLSRAVDGWSGSIVVSGADRDGLEIWGIADQLVQRNVRVYRESTSGFRQPGLLTVTIDGVGQLSAFHRDFFLGAIAGHSLTLRETNALKAEPVVLRIKPHYKAYANAIKRTLDELDERDFVAVLLSSWADVVARLCIGLRRFGTGGAFIFTPLPIEQAIDIGYSFPYQRLRDALILNVLDDAYLYRLQDQLWEDGTVDEDGKMSRALHRELSLAEGDAEDRESELAGAAKLVSSLAALDGAVVLDPSLSVFGFAAKIGNGPAVRTVLEGRDYARHGAAAKRVDISAFGTRHLSMLRYCRLDPRAVGVVVSQDGQVRVVTTTKRTLLMWDHVKLLRHDSFSAKAVQSELARRDRMVRYLGKRKLGYTSMPKTIAELLKV